MAQDWESNTYQIDHIAEVDLQNIEDNFATLKSSFSGTSSPSGSVYGQLWYDTTNHYMKVRSSTGNSWKALMIGDNTTPMWMYVDSTPVGWVAVGGTTVDHVIAIKGNATYTTGGTTQGSWITNLSHNHTITAVNMSHNHKWIKIEQFGTNQHKHQVWNVSGTPVDIDGSSEVGGGFGIKNHTTIGTDELVNDAWTMTQNMTTGYTEGLNGHSHGGTTGSGDPWPSNWRPNAAVGILVRPHYTT